MGNTSYRYVINALGKGGQTYLTCCQDKHELKKWLADHEDDLVMNELKIIDKKKQLFLKLFSLKDNIIRIVALFSMKITFFECHCLTS